MMTHAEKKEAVAGLTIRYVTGEISEIVYQVSLHKYLDVDEIRHLIMLNQTAHRTSLPFKRGTIVS